jgi:hypothetical protein
MVYGVFKLPLPRNAQKRTTKKIKEKNVGWWVGGSGIQQMHGGVRRFCFGGPSSVQVQLQGALGT